MNKLRRFLVRNLRCGFSLLAITAALALPSTVSASPIADPVYRFTLQLNHDPIPQPESNAPLSTITWYMTYPATYYGADSGVLPSPGDTPLFQMLTESMNWYSDYAFLSLSQDDPSTFTIGWQTGQTYSTGITEHGPSIYTGSAWFPTFTPGTYTMGSGLSDTVFLLGPGDPNYPEELQVPLAGDQLTIELLGNSSSPTVPEPGTFSLMALGFLTTAHTIRRRSRP